MKKISLLCVAGENQRTMNEPRKIVLKYLDSRGLSAKGRIAGQNGAHTKRVQGIKRIAASKGNVNIWVKYFPISGINTTVRSQAGASAAVQRGIPHSRKNKINIVDCYKTFPFKKLWVYIILIAFFLFFNTYLKLRPTVSQNGNFFISLLHISIPFKQDFFLYITIIHINRNNKHNYYII